MFIKNNRVTRKLFRDVLKSGKLYHSPHFSVRVEDKGATKVHTTFIVPKKIAVKAVIRNKIKRRGYYAIQTFLPDIQKPFTGLFFVKKGTATLTYGQYKEEITSLLREAKLLS